MIKENKQSPNMTLKIYFLKDMIVVCRQKMTKNRLLTPNKSLSRLLTLLANNSSKLKNEIRQILSFCISKINSPKKLINNQQQSNQLIIIMGENTIVIRNPKIFYINFFWPKNVA